MQPAFEDEAAINPFDFWKGANFKLKIRKVDVIGTTTNLNLKACQQLLKMMTRLNQSVPTQHALKPFLALIILKPMTNSKRN